MTPIQRLGLIANLSRPNAKEGLAQLLRAAKRTGITLLGDCPVDLPEATSLESCAPEDFTSAGAQGVISLGGDGSLLAAAHRMRPQELPLIGLNIGHLGYLTAVNEEGFSRTLEALAQGHYAVEERLTLAATAHPTNAPAQPLPDALNDVVISRTEGGHAIALHLELDGFPVARWLCDGIILSTPTGSTAYALSVGGPVLSPDTPALGIGIIAPHALSARPLVIPAATRITVRVEEGELAASVTSDGQSSIALPPGSSVEAAASPHPFRLLTPPNRNPYAPLSRKLGWGAPFIR